MKITKHESEVRQSGEGVAAKASAAPYMERGKQLSETGAILGEVGQRMVKAQAFQEHTSAMNAARQQMDEIQLKSEADPNYKNSAAYLKEMEKVRNTASKGITMPSARREFETDFASLLNEKSMAVRQDSRKKLVQAGLGSVNSGLEQLSMEYRNAGDPVKQKQIVGRMDLLIDGAAKRGFITPEKAVEMRQKNMESIGVDKFYTDLGAINTTGQAGQMMEALRAGGYEQNGVIIDPVKKKAMMGALESIKKKFAQDELIQAKQQIDKNENDFGKRAVFGGQIDEATGQPIPVLSLEEINKAEVLGQISSKKAEVLRKYKTEPKTSVSLAEKSTAVAEMAQKLFEIDNDGDKTVDKDVTLKQLSDYRIAAFERYQKGALTNTQLQKALTFSEMAFRNGVHEEMNPSFGFFKTIWNNLTGGKKQPSKEKQAEMEAFVFNNMTDWMQKGEITAEDVPKIVKGIRKNWNLKNKPETGQYDDSDIGRVVEIGGNNYVIAGFYDDGEPNYQIAKGK